MPGWVTQEHCRGVHGSSCVQTELRKRERLHCLCIAIDEATDTVAQRRKPRSHLLEAF